MKKYREATSCSKCTSDRFVGRDKLDTFGKHYVPESWEEGEKSAEHLKVSCSSCGYTWPEKCADAS